MQVAIIGSNSFLAQYIISELRYNNFQVFLYGVFKTQKFASLDFKLFNYPDSLLDFCELLEFDVIIYTAGAGIQANLQEPKELIYELNSFIPIHLTNFLASNKYKGKLITFGSYFEIGNETFQKKYTEEELAISKNPVPNDYCISKRLLTRFLSSSPLLPNFYHLILPNIYGQNENPMRIIPYLVNSIKKNSEIKLTSGTQYRQYLHAVDIAKTVVDIIKSDYHKGLYNICEGPTIQIKDLAKKIFEITNNADRFDESILFGTNQRDDTAMPYLMIDNLKAQKTFDFQPQISLEEGIKTYL